MKNQLPLVFGMLVACDIDLFPLIIPSYLINSINFVTRLLSGTYMIHIDQLCFYL